MKSGEQKIRFCQNQKEFLSRTFFELYICKFLTLTNEVYLRKNLPVSPLPTTHAYFRPRIHFVRASCVQCTVRIVEI